ncbi:MAG: transposase [Planctomycetes bacterium]|nr:transposase [Planctomycetota bacterium]MBI3845432.1 transposase [Planctomycetota bacterium]
MARRPRLDGTGALHHVMNRGLAKRPIFHGADEVRYFLSRLAHAVRREAIQILAFVFLPNHFHLLVRTMNGSISSAIGVAENEYVRQFNRRQHRDGPLFRGRFASKRIQCPAHLQMVVRYIDRNPVKAGLVSRAQDYPWGSAIHYAKDRGPGWLTRDDVEQAVCDRLGLPQFDPAKYEAVFPSHVDVDEDLLVERGFVSAAPEPASWDDLLRGATAAVRDWMARKSCLADDAAVRSPLVPPDCVIAHIAPARAAEPGWTVRPDVRRMPGWEILTVGLLRVAAGLTALEIERRLGLAKSKVYRSIVDHAQLMERDGDYARRATLIASEAIRAFYRWGTARPGA